MAFEDVMATVGRWMVAVEAFAATGADLALRQSGTAGPPEVAAALRAVSEAAGLGDLAELPSPQQALVLGFIRTYVHQALDLIEEPAREPGWRFTDPVILDGWGRGSSMVPGMIASGAPEIGDVGAFLDVGTGVGLLAVTAASVWPDATIVGIDPWEPSLERARANVAGAGLDDRITLRNQDVVDLDDVEAYDCIWVPTFFLTEPVLDAALANVGRAARPSGWIVLGRLAPPPDPLADAVGRLRTVRGGGSTLETKRAVDLLERLGCIAVRALAPTPGVPMEFIVGQMPAG